MESNGEHDVYNSTTEPTKATEWFVVPTEILSRRRCLIKVVQVLLSFLAFVLEELVWTCVICEGLYVFEFFSCSAFLFTLLLLVLLSTVLHQKVGIPPSVWVQVDFYYTIVWAVTFMCSSLAFMIRNDDTIFEKAAASFGFLASVAFFVDFVVFIRTKGLPWKVSAKMAEAEGGDEAEGNDAEVQRPLNALPMNGNGTAAAAE